MIGVLRLLLQDLQRSAPFDKLWISELMDHKDDLLKDPIMSSHIHSVQKIIGDELGLANRVSNEEILHAFGVLRINSFGIDTPSGGQGKRIID